MIRVLALLLSLCASSWGQDQEQTVAAFAYRDFSGGLNDNADGINLEPNESPDLLNVVIDEPSGSLKPRNGFIHCGSLPSGNEATGLFSYSKADGTERLIVTDNENVYETPDCITYTTIKSGLSATARPYFSTVRNKLWIVNKSTHPLTWNGTTATLLDGRANTPSPVPPICQYLEYWKDRVWCARTNSEPSSVQFSALTDSSGNDLDPSTGSLSWPAANVIYIDRDGGCPIYGVKAYRDNLYVSKGECGIWRIVFNNDFDIAVVKTLSQVGWRFHDNVAELDNVLHFAGPDGFYLFDGDQSVRISDKILNKFLSINQPRVNNLYKIWTSQGDFDAGTSSLTATADTSGSVTLSSTVVQDSFGNSDLTANPAWTFGANQWVVESGYLRPNTNNTTEIYTPATQSTGSWVVSKYMGQQSTEVDVHFVCNGTTSSCAGYFLRIRRNADSSATLSVRENTSGDIIASGNLTSSNWPIGSFADLEVTRDPNGIMKVYSDSVFVASGTDTTYNTSTNFLINDKVQELTATRYDDIFLYHYATSGTFTSDAFNAVTVSTWGTFEAGQTTNGGTIVFEVRVGTDAGGLSAATYGSITPGAVIDGSTTEVRIQWRAHVTGSNRYDSPQVDDVTVNYSQNGVATQSLYGVVWKNRYWVSGSTGSSTTNNMVLIKSRNPSNAWVPHDLQIGPMVRYNDNFYAGASTHSAIYRLDYGTNDNGAAFTWYWQSRDEVFSFPHNFKRLMELSVDYRKGTAANAKVGFRRSDQSSFTESSVDMSGSGRGTKRLFTSGGISLDYRFQIRSTAKDEYATILGLTPLSIPQRFRQ